VIGSLGGISTANVYIHIFLEIADSIGRSPVIGVSAGNNFPLISAKVSQRIGCRLKDHVSRDITSVVAISGILKDAQLGSSGHVIIGIEIQANLNQPSRVSAGVEG